MGMVRVPQLLINLGGESALATGEVEVRLMCKETSWCIYTCATMYVNT
jgi:hypothetical protein